MRLYEQKVAAYVAVVDFNTTRDLFIIFHACMK